MDEYLAEQCGHPVAPILTPDGGIVVPFTCTQCSDDDRPTSGDLLEGNTSRRLNRLGRQLSILIEFHDSESR